MWYHAIEFQGAKDLNTLLPAPANILTNAVYVKKLTYKLPWFSKDRHCAWLFPTLQKRHALLDTGLPFPPCAHQGRLSPACQAQLLLVSQFLTCSSPSILTCVPSPPGLKVLVSLLGSRFWSPCAVLLPTCFLLGGDVLLLSQTPRRSVQVPQRQPYQTLLLSSPVWPWSPLPSSIPSFLLCLCGHDFQAFFLLTPVSSSGLPRCCQSPRPGLALFHQCSSPSPSTGKSGSFPSPVARRLWSEGEEGQVSALSPMGWTGGGLHPHLARLPDGVGSA